MQGAQGEMVSVIVAPGREISVAQNRLLFSPSPGSSGGTMDGYCPRYDVTADGQRFLFPLGAEPAGESFVVLLGWQRGLRP